MAGNTVKKIVLGMVAFLLAVLLGFGLMLLSGLIPMERVHGHVKESVSSFKKEGNFPYLIKGEESTELDNNSDAWMLLIADYESDESLTDRVLLNNNYIYTFDSTGLIGMDNLPVMKYGEELGTFSYGRYWNGYLLFLKLMLLLFDYSEIRMLLMAFESLLLIALFFEIRKRLTAFSWIPLFAMLAVIMPISTMLDMFYAISFICMLITILIILKWGDAIESRLGYGIFFMLVGMAVAFFELLSYPLITLGIPLVVLMLINDKEREMSIRREWTQLVSVSFLWGVGYAGMWMAKWTIGTILTPVNIWADAVNQLFLRTSDSVGETAVTFSGALSRSFGVISTPVFKVVFVLCTVFILALGIYNAFSRQITASAGIPVRILHSIKYFAVMIYPFMWVRAFLNYSYIHYHFAYRIFAIMVFAAFSGVLYLLGLVGDDR